MTKMSRDSPAKSFVADFQFLFFFFKEVHSGTAVSIVGLDPGF